ncbi:hypothetical protein Hs30E_11970 [Lactococcus hodotermopsidis]|uniref:HTH gntR-type domain-containing protein n=1 Tax=Pseudolactococcus hodotermopsidis TaxID=2709157 RepID=A0A6A0BCS4_9LACT|nr:FadR/GntR family transcriptional regulator [Lactococcus hodotermopsidis]GFH42646.1 hypothetical protein Hs30E_11970 [Lactococcus hodotermopsidis]
MKKIEKKSLSAQVFETLKAEIVSGNLKVGDKLPSESSLVEQLGVGKYSIRTALQKLENVGLIEIRVGKGSFVRATQTQEAFQVRLETRLSENDVREISEYRLTNEVAIVNLAMTKATAADYKKLRKILRNMDQAMAENDLKRHSELDYQFHLAICKMTRNEILISTYEFVAQKIWAHTLYLNEIYIQQYTLHEGEDLHWCILKAMQAKDKDTCYQCYLEMLGLC